MPPAGIPQLLLYALATIVLSSLSWYAVERPINDLKLRFFYVN